MEKTVSWCFLSGRSCNSNVCWESLLSPCRTKQ